MKKWHSIFEEEERTIRGAANLLEESEGSVFVEDYELLLVQYKKLYRQSIRLVNMGDRIQGQLNRLYEKLTQSEEKYRNIFERSVQGIYRSTPDGRFIDVNPSMARIFGYESTKDMVSKVGDIGKDLFYSDHQRQNILRTLRQIGKVVDHHLCLKRMDGDKIWVELSAKGVFDEHGMLIEIQGLLADVTEKRRRIESLKTMARIDGLTGLWNRGYFLELGKKEVSSAQQQKSPLSLVYFDLDHFKGINDNHGHQCGDMVLKKMADIVREILRDVDIFGRMGGDEFAILLPGTHHDGAKRVADRLRNALCTKNHQVLGAPISITASFGVAQLGRTASCLSSLIKQADLALYRAKRQGRNQVSCNAAGLFHETSFSGATAG